MEDVDEQLTHPEKVSGFHGLKKCYVFNVTQYYTLFILFWNIQESDDNAGMASNCLIPEVPKVSPVK